MANVVEIMDKVSPLYNFIGLNLFWGTALLW